jgi:Ca2+-transporting ATPase
MNLEKIFQRLNYVYSTMDKEWHSSSKEETLKLLGTSGKGLSDETARQRLDEYGPNELVETKGTSPLMLFLRQFKEVLVIILIIAALISAAIATVQGTLEEWFDAAVIMFIVFLNAILGFVQEYKAEKTMQALKELAAPRAKVIRNSIEIEIPSRDLVPGDIIMLATGDKISADARLLESVNLKVNEASLTGESVPIRKNAEAVLEKDVYLGEKTNMVFSGCAIEYGRGRAVVTSTGMSTALGKIAGLIQAEPEQTPLQKKLKVLGKQLGIAVLLISVFIFIVGLIQKVDIVSMFLTSVSLAVAAIPEGLPAVVTISLALGLQRMVKKNAVIRRLPAVESLGSATVICTDKTGTLTKGEMNIREIFVGETIFVSGEGFEPVGEFTIGDKRINPLDNGGLRWLLNAGILCNDATLIDDNGKWRIGGDTTEGTLIVTARKAGIDEDRFLDDHPRVFEIPFDSTKKRMTTINRFGEKKYAFCKGAAESVVSLCNRICMDGQIFPLDEAGRTAIKNKDSEMASRALRVLALTMREVDDDDLSEDSLEKGLVFLGLVGMIDSPRTEAIEAIRVSKKAGIQVKMITGDHALTAKAIAMEMGIDPRKDAPVMTGKELEEISLEELSERVKEVNVYARVAPEHKVKIVDALKQNGEIVAMTGDGVNDAPALKKADIGIAMGITGTDVSKEASEMVLVDDNFASIVSATEEGRGIYDNIKKFVSFLLSCNAGEVATMFIATLIFVDPEMLPFLLPIQILWINLVTDGLPALALGVEPTDPDVMERSPRNPDEPPVTRAMAYRIVIMGLIMAIGTLAAFWIEYSYTGNIAKARTVAFCTLVLLQLFYVFSARSERRTLFDLGIRSNMKLVYAVIASVALQLIVVYLPFLNEVFRTESIGLTEWLITIPIALSAFIINETWKMAKRRATRVEPS